MLTDVRLLVIVLALLAASCGTVPSGPDDAARPEWLLAGPMLGHVAPRSATVWLQVKDGTELRAHAVATGDRRIDASWIEDLGDGCRKVHFDALDPNETVDARIDAAWEFGVVELSFRTAPPPSANGRVTVAFGSCVKDSNHVGVPVFHAMAAAAPDIVVFGGDNCYFEDDDWEEHDAMLARHLTTRVQEDLQGLLRVAPCYAVWDDHDYGPNNSGREFWNKRESLRAFRQMWANPSFGTDDVEGCFSSFRRGPVEVFLMDDRFHKFVDSPDKDENTIWGAEQFDWLCRGLLASTAPVKLIANGTQVLFQGSSGEGTWREARREYRRFLQFVDEHRIGGIVFLTGDRHTSELMRLDRPGKPAILDFTSSPIQRDRFIGPLDERDNPTRVWGMSGNSFGFVTVEVGADRRGTIALECRDEHDEVPVIEGFARRTVVDLAELSWPNVGESERAASPESATP